MPHDKVIHALHEVNERLVHAGHTRGYGLEALKQTMPIHELLYRMDRGERGMPTYCHGRAAAAINYLVYNTRFNSRDVRGRVVLVDRFRDERPSQHYDYHTVIEHREGDKWRLLDPGESESGFELKPGFLRSWEAKNGNPEKLKRGRDIDPMSTAAKVMVSDLKTAVDGPYQPWEYDILFDNHIVNDPTALAIYKQSGDLMEKMLMEGDPLEMSRFKTLHKIRLARRQATNSR